MTLTANRFDEIKKFTAGLHGEDIQAFDIKTMAIMLAELAAEVDRLRQPTQVTGRNHLKPVVLDAQGKPIAPPPLSSQFAAERREQYDADRYEALMACTPAAWRVFSLRWGLSPPPGGWGNHEAIMNVLHAVRLSVKAVPYLHKHQSATALKARGFQLPPGVTLINGELRGVELPE